MRNFYISVDKHWFGDYTPTEDALRINRQRIKERS